MADLPDDKLDRIEALLNEATKAPWAVWDSCSFRRITHERDGDVISAYNQRSDNHPDLLAKREDLDLLCELRNNAPALLASARREKRLREALQTVRDDVALVQQCIMHVKGLETTLQVIDEALKDD